MKTKQYIKLPGIPNQKIRQKYYTPESITYHPAKANIPTMIWILKKFVKDGDIVLDPMAGIFTTGIEGMRFFPNSLFIGVELEDKFVKMARANIKKVKTIAKKDMFMKIGKGVVVQGDARELEKIMKEKVNKIISSPPFEQTISGKAGGPTSEKFNAGGSRKLRNYSDNEDNIGNLKGKTYLGEMLKVYRECFKILKPGGLMILITKDFIRNKKRVRLGEDTIKLCQAAGFTFKEIYYRKIEHPSFWRILYQQKHPEVEKIDSEDILVFEKTSSP